MTTGVDPTLHRLHGMVTPPLGDPFPIVCEARTVAGRWLMLCSVPGITGLVVNWQYLDVPLMVQLAMLVIGTPRQVAS